MQIIDDKQRIIHRGSRDYQFDIQRYFNEGWELFKQGAGVFIGFTLIYFVILVLTSTLTSFIDETLNSVINFFITPIFTIGMLTGAEAVAKKGRLDFEDLFRSTDRYLHLLLFNLIAAVMVGIGLVLLVLPGIWVMIALTLGSPLLILTRLGVIESIEASLRVVTKKWFYFLLFVFLLALVIIVGVLACGVGLLAAIPLSYCILYACFRHVTQAEGDENVRLEDHLVDDDM